MNEESLHRRRIRHKPTFLLIPRKLIIAQFVIFLCMLAMTVASIQWANFVDRRSNQRWCKIVLLFNEGYKDNPPTTKLGKDLASEMLILQKEFYCKSK